MSGVVDLLNRWGAAMTALAGIALWQAAVVAIIVAIVAFALRRGSPAVRYWLWQLVAIKLLLLPLGSWSIGLAWLPALTSTSTSTPLESAVAVSEFAVPSPAALQAQPSETQQVESLLAEIHRDRTPQAESHAARQKAKSPLAAPPLATSSSERSIHATSEAKLTWQAWLLIGWAVAVALQLVRLLLQRRRLGYILRATTPGSGELVTLVNQVAAQLHMRSPPVVAVTQLDCSPFACGVLRPQVVVPASLLAELSVLQLKQILAHELAHLARRDLVWGWITELARLLYFFHPAMLWAARRVRLERELACDQIAMRLSGRGAAEYAETLVRALSSASTPSAFRTAAASLDGGDRRPRSEESGA